MTICHYKRVRSVVCADTSRRSTIDPITNIAITRSNNVMTVCSIHSGESTMLPLACFITFELQYMNI